jgi:hypothetical protein
LLEHGLLRLSLPARPLASPYGALHTEPRRPAAEVSIVEILSTPQQQKRCSISMDIILWNFFAALIYFSLRKEPSYWRVTLFCTCCPAFHTNSYSIRSCCSLLCTIWCDPIFTLINIFWYYLKRYLFCALDDMLRCVSVANSIVNEPWEYLY